jgi:predicted transposase/invertase (TIGR01784 family)
MNTNIAIGSDPDATGEGIVNTVFGQRSVLSGKLDNRQREAYRNLYAGMMAVFRNRYAHRIVDPSPEVGRAIIVFIEFQTLPKKKIPFRMLDYWVRGHRLHEDKTMRQVVIYLKPTTSELAYQTSYELERTRHEFDVIRLWEQPASLFLQYPGLLPFATLGQSESPEGMLRQVTQLVDRIEDPTTQANLMAASAILAGLRLEEDVIYRLVQRDIMQESVIYRSIQQERDREIALNLLQEGVSIETVARSTGLSIKEVQQLQQQLNCSAQN